MRSIIAVSLISLTLGGGAAPRQITLATSQAVQAWVTAVEEHTPGKDDDAVAAVHAMSFEDRSELYTGLGLFFTVLKDQGVITRSEPQRWIAQLGRDARQHPGAAAFLKRAAVLHSDAAVYNDYPMVQPVGPPLAAQSVAGVHPLLLNHQLTLDKDGEILGSVSADWNWPFARSLLDLLSPKPADDPFVSTWYHAISAYMIGSGLYGEATPHLQRAAVVLLDDAKTLFDRASYAEIMGLPKTQVLLSDDDIYVLEGRRTGRRLPMTIVGGASELGIPLAAVTNEEAERLFRRALKVDPDYVEARVRLARLLEVRKRYDEAAAELATALAAKPVGYLAYYAHLFAGRAAQALGRIDEAMAHYREASALYPGAQSALLAESQAALLGADVPATLAPIDHLDHSSSARDPWWQYDLAAGRDADAILAEMWKAVLRF